jgi:hypothetical protein
VSVFPIVARELRVAARRRQPYGVRVAAAAVAVVAGAAQLWLQSDLRPASGQGADLFATLGLMALGFALVSGPLWTTGTLCEERREGTLGLLFLTDLGPWDVVLGKLAAASVTALFSLAAVLPVLALSLLLGGVSLEQFGRAVLVLGNTLWLSLTLGMAASAWCEQERSATALCVFGLFLLAAVLPWLHAGLEGRASAQSLVVLAVSPLGAWWGVTSSRFALAPGAWWAGWLAAHALGWACLLGAAWRMARVWREHPGPVAPGFWRRLAARFQADPVRLRERRRRLLDRHPLLWAGARHELKRTLLWGGVGSLVAGWLVVRWLTNGTWWTPGLTLVSAWLLQAGLKWLAASEAAFRLAEARRSGALELLLTSGLAEGEIVRGHQRALRRLFGVPMGSLLAAEALLLVTSYGMSADYAWFAAALGLLLWWDVEVLAQVATWYSVTGRQPQRAALRAVARVLVVPWLAFLLVLFVVGVWNWPVVGALGVLVSAGSNLLAWRTTRAGLTTRFREAVAGVWSSGRGQELALV